MSREGLRQSVGWPDHVCCSNSTSIQAPRLCCDGSASVRDQAANVHVAKTRVS